MIRTISLLVAAIAGIFATDTVSTGLLPPMVGQIAGLVAAICAVVLTWAERHLPASKKSKSSPAPHNAPRSRLPLIVLSLCVPVMGCGGTYHAAWKTTKAIRGAGTAADQAIAAYIETTRRKCLEQHGSGTQGYAACTAQARRVYRKWSQIYRPAANAALLTTVAGLQIAEKTDEEDFNWQSAIRPAACVLLEASEEFSELLDGTEARPMLAYLRTAHVWICE
jgi:hypothetical protein